MSRKKRHVVGQCRLCRRENIELTFEHIPPESAFNNKKVELVSGEDMLSAISDAARKPWDMEGLPYVIQQRGDGGYYLCSKCNNNTGEWYVKKYSDFIQNAMEIISKQKINHGDCFTLKTVGIYPLEIIKQILVMFCDINPNLSRDERLRNFLLTPESNDFDPEKYRIVMFGFGGGIPRRSTCFGTFNTNNMQAVLQSEIISPPFGFILYIDPPSKLPSNDLDITNLAFMPYDEKQNIEFTMFTKETYSMLPGVYQPKEEM